MRYCVQKRFHRLTLRVLGYVTRYSLRVPGHLLMYSRQSVHLCYDSNLCINVHCHYAQNGCSTECTYISLWKINSMSWKVYDQILFSKLYQNQTRDHRKETPCPANRFRCLFVDLYLMRCTKYAGTMGVNISHTVLFINSLQKLFMNYDIWDGGASGTIYIICNNFVIIAMGLLSNT